MVIDMMILSDCCRVTDRFRVRLGSQSSTMIQHHLYCQTHRVGLRLSPNLASLDFPRRRIRRDHSGTNFPNCLSPKYRPSMSPKTVRIWMFVRRDDELFMITNGVYIGYHDSSPSPPHRYQLVAKCPVPQDPCIDHLLLFPKEESVETSISGVCLIPDAPG